MPRVIAWFNKDDEWIAGQRELPDIPLHELKKAFPDSLNDPELYYCYDITEEHVPFFKKYIEFVFDFNKYDYSLQYDADQA